MAQTAAAQYRNYVLSYPKAGRTWLRMLIGRYLCETLGAPLEAVTQSPRLLAKAGIPTHFTHGNAAFMNAKHYRELSADKSMYRDKYVLLLGRDVRDMVVSAYFHATKRMKVYEGPISEFVRNEYLGTPKILAFFEEVKASYVPDYQAGARASLEHAAPQAAVTGRPVEIRVDVANGQDVVKEVVLHWRRRGVLEYRDVAARRLNDRSWRVRVTPPADRAGYVLEYYLEGRDVGGGVAPHDPGVELALVEQPHGDAVGVRHHVVVGQDVAVGRDDEPRPRAAFPLRAAVLGEELLEAGRQPPGRRALLALRLDEHHRRLHVLRHRREGVAQVGGGLRGRDGGSRRLLSRRRARGLEQGGRLGPAPAQRHVEHRCEHQTQHQRHAEQCPELHPVPRTTRHRIPAG